MTPAEIITRVMADGVNLSLSPFDTIKATGKVAAVNRWLPRIREEKTGILTALRQAVINVINIGSDETAIAQLSTDYESAIRTWLAYIEETNPDTITEVLNKCRSNPDALRYFLQRAEEVPETVTTNKRIICGVCIHFERTDHPHLGHCAKGEPEAIAGLWDTNHRYCERYLATSENFTFGDKLNAEKVETKR